MSELCLEEELAPGGSVFNRAYPCSSLIYTGSSQISMKYSSSPSMEQQKIPGLTGG